MAIPVGTSTGMTGGCGDQPRVDETGKVTR